MKLSPKQELMRPKDLRLGEWQLWCSQCGFKFPKNAAAVPECPDCWSRFVLIGTPAPGDDTCQDFQESPMVLTARVYASEGL